MQPPSFQGGRPRFDIADIVRAHGEALARETPLTLAQRRVVSAIASCRTAALVGHLDLCCSCGHVHPSYNSCRNRHCPKCQALAQERWIVARQARVLPVRHFHVVFTLPSELRRLGQWAPKLIFTTLFRAASETLLELGRSRLHANIGVTAVLHTWTRDLRFHPHVHCIVTAGGLAEAGDRWVSSDKQYLFPVEVMGTLLRGKVMQMLHTLRASRAFDGFDDFRPPDGFDRLMRQLARSKWVVYAKKPFCRADHVLRYLGRYTHRVGLSNSRLVDVTENTVTFRTKDGQTVTLSPIEFLGRFLQHVLPPSFVKIRHFGLLAGAHVDGKLEQARQLLAPQDTPSSTNASPSTDELSWESLLRALNGKDVWRCPVCGAHVVRQILPPLSRAPPRSIG
jgi:hypothetical protein